MTEFDKRKHRGDRIICKKELRSIVPYTSQHIARLEKEGKFPKRLQLGPNRVGWLESEVNEWIDGLKIRRDGPSEGLNAAA
jgi:prophage regulatory protein